jgi:kynurenine formamidase
MVIFIHDKSLKGICTMTNVLNDLAAGLLDGSVKVVDLTQTLGPDTPIIHLPEEIAVNSPPFSMKEISKYDDNGPAWYWNVITLGEHTGTHFDAPIHWISGKEYADGGTDTIPAQNLVGPACVIDCSSETAADKDFLLTAEGVKAWEKEHGDIPKGAWVLMRTDWLNLMGRDNFLNADDTGPHSPGPTACCIEYLIEKDVLGWGAETVGTDAGQAAMFDVQFPAHSMMHGANKYGLASLTNLDKLPATGAIVVAPPLKIENGSGSPLRVLAMIMA